MQNLFLIKKKDTKLSFSHFSNLSTGHLAVFVESLLALILAS